MSTILSFIASFSVISVTLGALYMLCPEGTLQKSVKYVFVLLLLCSMIALITGMKKVSFDFEAPQYRYQPENAQAIGMKLNFERALKNEGIEFSKITVCTDKSKDGSIIISEVIVYSSETEEKILNTIGNPTEYEVTVINE